jgi:Protein of unknown function (DUF2798)
LQQLHAAKISSLQRFASGGVIRTCYSALGNGMQKITKAAIMAAQNVSGFTFASMSKPSLPEIKFASLMSFVTTLAVTLVLVSVNYGWHSGFLTVWLRSWLIAFVLVGLSILYVAPVLRKWLAKK